MKKIIMICLISLSYLSVFCQTGDKVKLIFHKDSIEKNNTIVCSVLNESDNRISFYLGAEYLNEGKWEIFSIDLDPGRKLAATKIKLWPVKTKSNEKVSYRIEDMFADIDTYNMYKGKRLRLRFKYFVSDNFSDGKIIYSDEFSLK